MSLRYEIILLLLAWALFVFTFRFFLYFDFFWLFWWADIFMHTWGGGMLVMSWYTIERTKSFPRTMAHRYNQPLLVLLIIMIGWEIFEYSFGIANTTDYVFDTMQDFIMGGLGGIIVYLWLRSRTIKDIKL